MASKVKVVDSNFRQVEVKVNPATHLTEILEQACAKLKADPSKHLLKYKQRQLDLSHTWRTSGLAQGAKLELVVKSKTPTAVDIALQLPPPESDAFPPYGRLTEKLPSDVTIWKLLRHFESGKPSAGRSLNITGRGVPQTENGSVAGSGQLYYETPVLHVDNRQLSTFDDFQKTLSQLGYNSGRVLIRLSFQRTDKTLVDAMADIDRYFQEEQTAQQPVYTETGVTPSSDPTAPSAEENVPQSTTPATEGPTVPDPSQDDKSILDTTAQAPVGDAMDVDEATQPEPSPDVTIFAAPTSATPAAALQADSEDAFIPGIEHAKAHQRLLRAAGQNKRLPSDQEIAEREAAERKKLADTSSVRIRVRLPDNSLLERDFGRDDTGATLYAVVRGAMAHPTAPFRLTYPAAQGGGARREVIRDADDASSTLIAGHRFRGQVIVTFVWDDAAPADVRRPPFLKQSAAARAQKVVVPEVPDAVEVDGGGGGSSGQALASAPAPPRRGLDALKGKTPKWLKGFGKK
ncbi:hypothetical protein DL768_004681 [Monosporascus sp. mg162]|nr:hypothetical protein DL768_004681 [Monosporascus sp. mg162]